MALYPACRFEDGLVGVATAVELRDARLSGPMGEDALLGVLQLGDAPRFTFRRSSSVARARPMGRVLYTPAFVGACMEAMLEAVASAQLAADSEDAESAADAAALVDFAVRFDAWLVERVLADAGALCNAPPQRAPCQHADALFCGLPVDCGIMPNPQPKDAQPDALCSAVRMLKDTIRAGYDHPRVLQRLDALCDEAATARQRTRMARVIQLRFRDVISDPRHPMCRRRLLREFAGLAEEWRPCVPGAPVACA